MADATQTDTVVAEVYFRNLIQPFGILPTYGALEVNAETPGKEEEEEERVNDIPQNKEPMHRLAGHLSTKKHHSCIADCVCVNKQLVDFEVSSTAPPS